VAAHLNPEILIVDEVLAVGDVEFQKKCLSRMAEVARSGRTVLMVSHSMEAVTRLCTRCLLLQDGQLRMDGPAMQVANAYLNVKTRVTACQEWADLSKAPGDEAVRMCAVRVVSREGKILETVDISEPVGIEIEFEVFEPGHLLLPLFDVVNEGGTRLLLAVDLDPAWRRKPRPAGRYVSTGWIPGNLLPEGLHTVGPGVLNLNPDAVRAELYDAVAFRVVDPSKTEDSADGSKLIPGLVRPRLRWTTEYSARDAQPKPLPCPAAE
jgi:lipopolysaccharide transport system ATP-binding protein